MVLNANKNRQQNKSTIQKTARTKNGPAAKGGLLKNDILISIDNNKASYENLYKTFARSKPGDDIFLEIERNNQILELAFTTERIN